MGIGVGHREHLSAQKRGDLLAVDLVVLGLAAVDGLHVQGVAEDEGDVHLGAQIGDPVPAEHAFHRHRQVLRVGLDGGLEGFGAGGQVPVQKDGAAVVLDAEIHPACVKIDAAVV